MMGLVCHISSAENYRWMKLSSVWMATTKRSSAINTCEEGSTTFYKPSRFVSSPKEPALWVYSWLINMINWSILSLSSNNIFWAPTLWVICLKKETFLAQSELAQVERHFLVEWWAETKWIFPYWFHIWVAVDRIYYFCKPSFRIC